jgi:uncharacterized RmlC-like cupin family protein
VTTEALPLLPSVEQIPSFCDGPLLSTNYVLSGEAEMWYGEGLQEYTAVNAGDFVYIPAGMPHLPGNRSQTEPCHALIARTDPNEQESVVLLPELDELQANRKPM